MAKYQKCWQSSKLNDSFNLDISRYFCIYIYSDLFHISKSEVTTLTYAVFITAKLNICFLMFQHHFDKRSDRFLTASFASHCPMLRGLLLCVVLLCYPSTSRTSRKFDERIDLCKTMIWACRVFYFTYSCCVN